MKTGIQTLILVGMPRCGVWRTARRAVPTFIALLLLALPVVVQAQFDYTVNPGGASVTITGYTGSGGDVTIPDTINGLPVTSIGGGAFNYSSLTSVTIPNSVTTIGDEAFEFCFSLTSVTIPNSVTNVENLAFFDCQSLTNVIIGNGVTTIEDRAFDGCVSLTAITVAALNPVYSSTNGVLFDKNQTEIIKFPGAFEGQYAIPNTVTSIVDFAFGSCRQTYIIIPDSITSIGEYAFFDCQSLTNVIIGNGVTTIGDSAFYTCYSLTSVTIPGSVTNIGYESFGYCYSLTSVFFTGNAPAADSLAFDSDPATVYYLSGTLGWSNTFAGLSTVMLNGPPQFGATLDGWDYVSDGIKIIITGYTGPDSDVTIPPAILGLPVIGVGSFALEYLSVTSVVIPSSVSNIGNEAFEDCNNLANVTIPDSVTDIGNQAFYNCVSLTNVTIGSNVTTIGDSAFQYCYDLTSVTIPNSVTTIGDYAFYYDNSLTNAIIGGGITNIGYYAFGCANLTSVFFTGNAPSVVQSNAFSYLTGGHWIPRRSVYDPATVYYLSGTLGWSNTFAGLPTVMLNGPPQFGATDDGWNYVSDGIQIIITRYTGPNSDVTIPPAILGLPVIGVGPFAFEYSGITSVVIPDSVSNIGSGAFKGCYSLTSVTIPNSVMSIGNEAFYDCEYLTNVTLGSSVATIGDGTFEDCYYLTSVTIPGSVTNIGNFVFAECYDLTAITVAAQNPVYSSVDGVLFDKNQTTLIQYPIGGIASSYVIPNGVTNIASGAFQECYLTNVTIGSGVVTIEDGAFEYCYNLTSMTIPNSVMSIGNETFYDCEYLTNVTIGGGVATIGDGAFEYCYDLTSIFFTGDAPSADSSAFSGDSYATAYYLSGTLGWSNSLAGLPTVMLNGPPQFGATLDGWNYVSDGVQIIITRYTGTGGNVVIPATINGLPVTTIGAGAFQQQYNLTSVTIPNSVTSVGDYAFGYCNNLTSILFEGNVPAADPSAFYGDSATVYYQIGTAGWGSIFAGLPALPWDLQTQCSLMITNGAITIISFKGLSGTVNIPDMFNGLPVTNIGGGAFAHSGLTSVTIGGNVTTIGVGAFEYCYNLTSVTISDSVTSIGDFMFYNDPQLASVTIGNSVTNIGTCAFLASSALTGITIPHSVIAIGDEAFADSGLTNMTIGGSVTTIGDYAFFDNVHLTGVTIGNSVTSIGQYAFAYNAGLTGITIPDSVITIGDFAFAYSGLTNVTTGNGITSIGKYEFYDDTGLAGVVIGSNVTNIGDHAFGDCPSLTGVFFMGNAPTIDSSAFGFAPATAYYLPGTTGWGDFSANAGVPTALWLPKAQTSDGSFGAKNHQFGFNIAWASGQTVVVEAATNLSNPVWLPVSTNTLVGGTAYFSDPQSSNYPARVYRLRSQ